jgi:hypothetical protein
VSGKPRVAIIGSCVTRDGLTASVPVDVVYYRARTSALSQLAKPTILDDAMIAQRPGFVQSCIRTDFRKDLYKGLSASKPDYVLVDYIDERFDLLERDDELVVKSDDMVLVNLHLELKNRGFAERDFRSRLESTNVGAYRSAIEAILRVVPCSRIIIHKAMCAFTYLDRNRQIVSFSPERKAVFEARNAVINGILSSLADLIGPDNVIDLNGTFHADENHRWSLAPFHYEPSYYSAFRSRLSSLVL